MKTLAEKIAVMQAAERGVPIESIELDSKHATWKDVYNPGFDWLHYDYRIAPKKKVVKYRRFLWRWVDGKHEVFCWHADHVPPSDRTEFVRWIDDDWQTVEV